jgi:peptidoglycan/LPS O-acetylase OafA/YrhL
MSGKRLHRPDIEGLRGIAVLMVVAYHAGIPWVRGGFVGVDVFFVLSGYLITGLLLEEIAAYGRINLIQFYARRIRRLLPAAAVMLLGIILAGSLLLGPMERVRVGVSARATALYYSNISFSHMADYFAPTAETNPLLHTWSLAVEEQFYLAWPLLLMFAAFLGRRSHKKIALILGLFTVGSLVYSLSLTREHLVQAFFNSPPRAWEFGVGGLASLVPVGFLLRMRRPLIGVAGLAFLLLSAVLFSADTLFPGVAVLLPVLGTAAALMAGAVGPMPVVSAVTNSSILQFLGRMSYSWYLWHWPVLVYAKDVFPDISLAVKIGCASLALAIAYITHRLVENPIRFNPYLMARPAATLAMGALLTVLGLGSASVWRHSSLAASTAPDQAELVRTAGELPLRNDGCLTDYANATVRECGSTSQGTKTVVLFGDSHSEQWYPAFQSIAKGTDLRIVTMLKAACPSVRVSVFNPFLRRLEDECSIWRESAISRILALHPSLVVMCNASGYIARPNMSSQHNSGRLSYSQWEDGTRSVLATFAAAGIHTLLIRDTPIAGYDMLDCLSRHLDHQGILPANLCTLDRSVALDDLAWQMEREAARPFTQVTLLDLTDRFCDGQTCQPERNGMVVLRDTNHISPTYSATLAGTISERVGPLLGL